MIIVLLAEGFEEIEALTPVDMLRRAKLQVKTVGIKDKTVVGAHGISIVCDMLADEVDYNEVDMVIFPGGMPGTLNLDSSPYTDIAINAMIEKGGRIAAICAAPIILGRRGLLKGAEATCYPGFENELSGASLSEKSVVTYGNITTARGMGVAIEFAEELIELLLSEERSREISVAICKTEKYDSSDKSKCCSTDKEYIFPSTNILNEYKESECDEEELSSVIKTVTGVFDANKIPVNIENPIYGPRTITLDISPKKSGIKIASILNLADDIGLALCSQTVRFVAPIPGDSVIKIEIPRRNASFVGLKPLIESDEFRNSESKTTVCLGRNTKNQPVISDIAKMPHLIIGGATGMGKSVLLNSIITSLLYKATPDEVKLVLIDPKQVELSQYANLPHLLHPIVTEPKEAAAILKYLNEEMERRYSSIASLLVRNIDSYNEKVKDPPTLGKPMAKIIVIVDEMADLMLTARDSIEVNILRIVQKARAVGIHLILATQRPTVDVISGIIKANIPSRICLKVMSAIDSGVILDSRGGERLLGQGDALYSRNDSYQSERIQSAFISDAEIVELVNQLSLDNPDRSFNEETILEVKTILESFAVTATDDEHDETDADSTDPIRLALNDENFLAAIELAFKNGKISTSLVQRYLCIGYGRAARYLDLMEELGIIGPLDGQKPRKVIISKEEWIKRIKKS